MPRGWHQTPSGWWQRSIRGPHSPSEKWPRAGSQQPSQPGRSRAWPKKSGQQQPSPPPLQQPSRAPESVVADAIADVSRLESAIEVLDNPHARPLLDALRVAKTQATVPPIHDRIKACKAFLDRARKRVCRAEAVIARAVEQKTIFDGEVADGEKRLQELLEEEVNVPVPVPSLRVAELQQQIDDLVREGELWRASQTRIRREQPGEWCAEGPQCVKEVPPSLWTTRSWKGGSVNEIATSGMPSNSATQLLSVRSEIC